MPKEVTLEELVLLAENAGVTNIEGHVKAIEGAIGCFAEHVASHMKIDTAEEFSLSIHDAIPSTVQFVPKNSGQRCPKLLKDFEGDWDH